MESYNFTDLPAGAYMDELPMLTTAHIKPYVIAILLHRGAVRDTEIINSLAPQCRIDDLKTGGWDPLEEDWCDGTRLEKLISEVLGEFVAEGILRYNESKDLWVLTASDVSVIISWVASLGGKIPQHLLLELSREQLIRIPNYISLDHEQETTW